MKQVHYVTASIFAILITVNQSAFAERSKTQQAALEGGTFIGTTAVATAAAGPVGFVLGAIGGAFLAKQTRTANQTLIELQAQSEQLDLLELKLTTQEEEITDLEEELIEKLTFQVLFATGDDQLNALDKRRVRILAYYLERNQDLQITLNGHADPRGTDEYNNVLSIERANAIKKELISLGIAEPRIVSQGFGNQYSKADKGDEVAYQQERRVDIVISPAESSFVSATDFTTTP